MNTFLSLRLLEQIAYKSTRLMVEITKIVILATILHSKLIICAMNRKVGVLLLLAMAMTGMIKMVHGS